MENKTPENTEFLSVKERLIKFINEENLSQSKFEKKANLSNGYVNNIKNSISDKIFDFRIHPAFPHLNKIWLFHGIGEMKTEIYKKENSSLDSPIKNKPHDEQMAILHKDILDLKKENEELKDMVDELTLKIEISLAPILRHFKLKADTKEKHEDKSSIN
ncbi:hypothetical protein [Chryseobacterium aureum]|uniref:hypothetical protein n=1 Tax=Chryseobacterium aureum TaxID=2497456 RepID=UPI000F894F2A|nr:hypothetical protein [Chryseobacterium aureum]